MTLDLESVRRHVSDLGRPWFLAPRCPVDICNRRAVRREIGYDGKWRWYCSLRHDFVPEQHPWWVR